ncbi:hypothetical protein RHDC4_00762 [Rhodocyclaceae bacterium]|nr:hypothetical protein RHDC4_00762 [Rhodocyclaceae bacterium]
MVDLTMTTEVATELSVPELRRMYSVVLSTSARRPLKIGIRDDLLAAHPGRISAKTAYQLLGTHTKQPSYLAAIVKGGPRYGLNGEVAGEVTEKERAWAIERLAALRAVSEGAHMVRKERSILLKKYEASGLDEGEFAQQQGIPLSALHSQLDTARTERLARHQARVKLVTALEASGLSMEEFAARERIPVSRLEKAQAKLRQKP